jgi:serine/threonine-protein kinase HipA
MAKRVDAQGIDAYDLLAAVGRDCVGALQFPPGGVEPGAAGAVNGRPIDDKEIARLLGGPASASLGLGEDENFRISIAGAQEKTVLLFWKGRWHKPGAMTATAHILKPQIGRLPNGIDLSLQRRERSFSVSSWRRRSGSRAPPSRSRSSKATA